MAHHLPHSPADVARPIQMRVQPVELASPLPHAWRLPLKEKHHSQLLTMANANVEAITQFPVRLLQLDGHFDSVHPLGEPPWSRAVLAALFKQVGELECRNPVVLAARSQLSLCLR